MTMHEAHRPDEELLEPKLHEDFVESAETPDWASVMADPGWATRIPDKGDKNHWDGPVTWDKEMTDAQSFWPPAQGAEGVEEGQRDADIMEYLRIGKEAPHGFESFGVDDQEKVLSYLGISESDKSDMLAVLGLSETPKAESEGQEVEGVQSSTKTSDGSTYSDDAQGNLASKADEQTCSGAPNQAQKPKSSTLNVTASPFNPANLSPKSRDEAPRLNPAAVPFVPSTVPTTPVDLPTTGTEGASSIAANDNEQSTVSPITDKDSDGTLQAELASAQAEVRYYQNIYTQTKQELQLSTKLYNKEKDVTRKAQELSEQKTEEVERLISDLQTEALHTRRANERATNAEADAAHSKQSLEQIQSQVQVTWSQFMTQFQLEKTKRENAEALVSQLQAELHTVRLESERSSLRISELQGTLEAAQMMSKQNVEKAETKERECNFYRQMYTTATKQVESSNAAVRASIEFEKQARREADMRLQHQAAEILAIKQQAEGKLSAQAAELNDLKRELSVHKQQV